MPYRSPSASSRTSPNFDLWLKLGLTLLFTSVMAAKAQALTMTPYLPHTADSVAGIPTVYYAHNVVTSATVYVDTADSYPNYDLNNSGSYQLNFDISGLDPAKPYLYAYAENRSNAGSYFQIPFRTASGGGSLITPTGAPVGLNAVLTNGSAEIDIALNLKDICTFATNAKGCDTTTVGDVDVTSTTSGFTIRLYQSETNTGSAFGNTEIDAADGLDLSPASAPPTISCPADISSWFFPGDRSIFVQTGAFIATKGTVGGVGSSVFKSTIVVAATPALGGVGTHLSNLKGRVPYNSGDQEVGVDLFENSTNAVPKLYQANIGVRDSAGIITFCAAPYSNIFASDIRSFLKESNCFIATASFRSGTTPEVMMLRKFRDQVLSNFELGRAFISFYYAEGPKAADWLISHPEFRVPVLLLLVPVQIAAWVALNPMITLSPLLAFGLMLLIFRRRTLRHGMKVAPLLIALCLAPSSRADEGTGSNQPFIDSLLSEIEPSKEPVRTNGNPDPYIQEQKKKLGASENSGSFIEEEKKHLGEAPNTDGYATREQKRLGKKPGSDSAIADFKSGRELKANKGGDRTKSAFAFKVSTEMNRTYRAGSAEDLSYEEVYGPRNVPELTLSYEYRPFESHILRNLGIYGSLGGSFTSRPGRFAYTNNPLGVQSSKAKFRFIVLPVNLGPIYRFSLGNFFFPYFGGGGSTVGFIETRTDDKEGMRGYSFGYWGVAGISFGLDWISPKTSWESYQSTGTKHTYLSLEYSYLQTLGGLIDTTVDGVQAGLTFEF